MSMNKEEQLVLSYLYPAIAIIGVLVALIAVSLLGPVLFHHAGIQTLFCILVVLGYLFLISTAADFFADARTMRADLCRLLYEFRDIPETDVSAPNAWDIKQSLRYIFCARLIPFLLLSYTLMSFIDTWVLAYHQVAP